MRGVDREKACTLFLEALLRSPRHSGSLKEIHNLTHNIKARQDWRATFEKLLSSEPRYKRIAPLVRQVVDAGPPASPGGH
jgi:hypothetical protein